MIAECTELLAEHEGLLSEIEEIREWSTELDEIGQPRFGEMVDRLKRLRDHLSVHFDHEEDGGYLVDALGRAPRLSPRAETLRRQHRELLESLRSTIDGVSTDASVGSGWNELRGEFERFVRRLTDHEQAERALLLEALETDIGAGD